MTMRMLLDHTRKSAQVVRIQTYCVSKWIVSKSEIWSFFSVYVGFSVDWGRFLLPGVNMPHNHLTHLCLYELTPFRLLLNATHMPGGNAASVWQPAECGQHRGQVCHIAAHLSASSLLWLVAGVRSDSDRLKLLCARCAYQMPAVTHPIAPLSLPRPELVCLGVHRSCCCAAAKHRSHKCHARTLLCSQDSMSNLAREWLGKRYFHTHTAHFRVR